MNRKLKKNKNFSPCNIEDNDELFPNGIFEFNISKMIDHIQDRKNEFPIGQIFVAEHQNFVSEHLDESTVNNADLNRPLLVAEISPGRYNVLDGHHRIEKAKRRGVECLPAFKTSPQVHTLFLTSKESYETYVDYWNEKLKERCE